MKKKLHYEEYIGLLSMLANASVESTREAFYRNQICAEEKRFNAIKLSLLYLCADLACHWLGLNKDTVQKDLCAQFYAKYPEDFFLLFHRIIKSQDTMLQDIYEFLAEILSPEDDAIARFEAFCFIYAELTPALDCFSAMLRSTKRKGEYFIVNFTKYGFLAKKSSKKPTKPEIL